MYKVGCGGIAKRSKAADCKSAGGRLRRFKSCSPHHRADLAQQAEHFHGKEGVAGSIPAVGSRKLEVRDVGYVSDLF